MLLILMWGFDGRGVWFLILFYFSVKRKFIFVLLHCNTELGLGVLLGLGLLFIVSNNWFCMHIVFRGFQTRKGKSEFLEKKRGEKSLGRPNLLVTVK